MLKTPKECIFILTDYGFNQSQIARLCGVGQGVIYKILSDRIKRPNYEITDKLRELVKTLQSKILVNEMLLKQHMDKAFTSNSCEQSE